MMRPPLTKPSWWPQDTIARRFTLTILSAVVVAASLTGLVAAFAGAWLRPPTYENGLFQAVISITRVLDAAPASLRPALTRAASGEIYSVAWYDARTPLAASLEHGRDLENMHPLPDPWRKELGRRTVLFMAPPGSATALGLRHDFEHHPDTRFLAVRLADAGWLIYTPLHVSQDLGRAFRIGTVLVLLLLSGIGVSLIAARQLSRPIERLAEAARLFGANPQAPPIEETGLRELRGVTHAFNAMQTQIGKFVGDRTAMLAAISHDLRTPLTRMRLRGEFVEDPEQQARLFRDVDEMQAMVDGALAFFRDDTDGEAVTAFDLAGLLTTIVDEYADQGVAIAYVGPAHAVHRGRPFALKRAFTNLIENAVKHATPPRVTLTRSDDGVAVLVEDEGAGLPPDALERVFSPFYRLDRSRNRATGGVGLGLTAALAIIRGHGGDIALRNRSEGGLEARVMLPAQS